MKYIAVTEEELAVLIELTALIPGHQGQELNQRLIAAAQSEPFKPWIDKMFSDYGYGQLTPEQQLEMDTLKLNKEILQQYPIQDKTWSSRRWKADGSTYCDLSAFQSEGDSSAGISPSSRADLERARIAWSNFLRKEDSNGE